MKEASIIHSESSATGERRIKAIAVSRGIAFGKIVPLFGRKRQYYRASIACEETAAEIRRVKVAFRFARRQLNRIAVTTPESPIPEIFDAQIAMLADSSLQSKIEEYITEHLVNAEWAVRKVTYHYISRFKAIPDAHLREKYIDLEDVADRILVALGGGQQSLKLQPDSIIAAKDLKPSTLVELSQTQPVGLLTKNGGWTSHTFILARELGIPALTGIQKLDDLVIGDSEFIIDGFKGLLIVDPTAATVEEYKRELKNISPVEFKSDSNIGGKDLQTTDGRHINILANIDIASTYPKAKAEGAHGIGLYRSEYLFNQFSGLPDEDEQYAAYCEIGDQAENDVVKIRLFDISQNEFFGREAQRELNPALGMRGLRLSLTHEDVFREQVRAILRASFGRNIEILLPMVTNVSEVREAKRFIELEKHSLNTSSIKTGAPKIGIMIETPAAVLIINELLEECDSIALGTNDLVQYLLAVDRDNEAVSKWFQTLHPAVIRSVKMVIDAAKKANKPLVICGEMAGSPYYLPLLVGLGADRLSMNVNSIRRICQLVSGISYQETKVLAEKVSYCRTTDEVEDTIRTYISDHASHLYSKSFLNSAFS